jgi:hypothetical protein
MSSGYGNKPIYLVQTIDETIALIIKIFANSRLYLEIMVDNDWLCHLVDNSSFMSLIKKLKVNNVPVRIATKVIQSNISYLKKLMKYVEVKNSDKLEGCSITNEQTFCFSHYPENEPTKSINEFELLDKLVDFYYIENKNFIKQQSLLFENLWKNSISAREKIIEIEKSVKEIILENEAKSYVDSNVNPSKILFRIVESCVDQLLILIPTTELFWSLYDSKLLYFISTMLVKEVTVKILIHVEEDQNALKDEIRYKLKELAQDLIINTNFFSKRVPHSHISIIVDNVVLAEAKYDSKNQILSKEEISPVISFFIQDARVSSSASMFDILWIQSDIERQNKIKQTYFDIFKGFNLKSENYNRDWNFERKKNTTNSANQINQDKGIS